MLRLWKLILPTAAAIGTISVAILSVDDLRNRFWPSENAGQGNSEPPTPIESDLPTDPLARRMTDDLMARLAATPCADYEIKVTEPARRDLPAAETSHGFDATFLQVGLQLSAPDKVTRITAAGSGKGPGAEIDAYSALLENVLQNLRTVEPDCFDED